MNDVAMLSITAVLLGCVGIGLYLIRRGSKHRAETQHNAQ